MARRPAGDDEGEPDYAALVEQQLRIAEGERWARLMWATICADYADEARRQRYVWQRR